MAHGPKFNLDETYPRYTPQHLQNVGVEMTAPSGCSYDPSCNLGLSMVMTTPTSPASRKTRSNFLAGMPYAPSWVFQNVREHNTFTPNKDLIPLRTLRKHSKLRKYSVSEEHQTHDISLPSLGLTSPIFVHYHLLPHCTKSPLSKTLNLSPGT